MSNIDLNLPEPMKDYVEKRAAECGCKDASEFIVSVLENHQHRQVRSEIESMLLEAVDGPFTEWTDQTVDEIRRQGTAIINSRRGS